MIRILLCYLYRSLLANLSGDGFYGRVHVPRKMQFICCMQKGQTFKLTCFLPFTSSTLGNPQPDTESPCGQASPAFSASQHHQLRLQLSHRTGDFNILQCRQTGRSSLGEHLMNTAKAYEILWNADAQLWASFSSGSNQANHIWTSIFSNGEPWHSQNSGLGTLTWFLPNLCFRVEEKR